MPLRFPLQQKMTAPLSESWRYNPEITGSHMRKLYQPRLQTDSGASRDGWIRGESWHSDANILISLNLPTCSPSTFENSISPVRNPITDLSCDQPSVSLLVTAAHTELILTLEDYRRLFRGESRRWGERHRASAEEYFTDTGRFCRYTSFDIFVFIHFSELFIPCLGM